MTQGRNPLGGKPPIPEDQRIDYSEDLDSLMDVNKKYGERVVDLAIEGWYKVTNSDNVERSIKWAHTFFPVKEVALETRVEDTAYTLDGFQVVPGLKALYIRGQGIKPNVPDEVIAEAKDYLARDRQGQIAFLRDVYSQIVLDEPGPYAIRFSKRRREIAAVLNYFADKLKGLGQTTSAEKLEDKVKAQFPRRKEEFNYQKEYKPY